MKSLSVENLFYSLSILFISVIEIHCQTDNLQIEINNIKTFEGEIKVSVYTRENDFLSLKDIFKYKIFPPSQPIEVISFSLPPGEYAIAAYHDIDNDGKMKRNILGIPKEPYGFSNNFKLKFSAPKFEDCKFEIKPDEIKNLEIQLNKY
ncbi:DUF2141 domain-containing protein [Mangrovivirga sp. M17]|uniref:DUF2141 domain-containing protein n=1 Tax=Mangrovivirga halotolerans TaxID=2993936 RepID=A0ABT3RNW4_9BACT|nr:DUF2141 domain-containing protein [Mangrovivirga halotolerans]MCX2743489.1 DUF2141 domain-containing protein [Mangrovivirga halotolerans]